MIFIRYLNMYNWTKHETISRQIIPMSESDKRISELEDHFLHCEIKWKISLGDWCGWAHVGKKYLKYLITISSKLLRFYQFCGGII